jgi:beta-glucanase (GH16 family)
MLSFSEMAGLLRALPLACILAGMSSQAFGRVIWSEEFDSGTALDSAVWSYDLGADGWGNAELQEYTNLPENVRIEDGNLVITALRTADGFTSARVRTEHKLTFKYATIEARIKMADLENGLWPAFWTLGNNFSEVGWPHCGELDIVEMGNSSAITRGLINRWVGSTAHWEQNESHVYYGRSLVATTDLNDDYHIFKMNWTPNLVTTYLDDQEIWAIDITSGSCTDCSEFHQPHFMILNMAVGGNYTGLLEPGQITAEMPAQMLVDYVRISDNGYTELGGTSNPEILPVVGQEYSGSWYNPEQSGHGFSMEFGEAGDGSPLAIVYWYTYDTSGKPIFLVGNGVPDDNQVTITFESPVGMQFGVFDKDSVIRHDGGTAQIEFSDSDNATFSYTPSDFTATTWGHTAIDSLPLQKLFEIPLPPVDTDSAE